MSSTVSKFSNRLPPNRAPNALSVRLAGLEKGADYIDLTESNPTRAGFDYPDGLLRDLASPRALTYDPHPFGLIAAREAVAADHQRRGMRVDPGRIVLTASTSEAYSWLFKLLCNPGDHVLVPAPSYPLFEHLTRLDGVDAVPYALDYHTRWEVDILRVRRAMTDRTRAVLAVSPNNPTGSYLKEGELLLLDELCSQRGVALVVDEVFADYGLYVPPDYVTDAALRTRALSFTLGGLSKSVGLPQVKLGWIVVGGEQAERARALAALELIADSYLSVSTPVQVAAPDLLAQGGVIRAGIMLRLRENLRALDACVQQYRSCQLLACEGGWYAVVRVPATRSEEEIVLDLLDRERILVHPGYFFDFPREAYLVVSLLPAPEVFADAAARMLHLTAGSL